MLKMGVISLGNVFFGGTLQIDAKSSNFEIFESTLSLKSVSMPLKLLNTHGLVSFAFLHVCSGKIHRSGTFNHSLFLVVEGLKNEVGLDEIGLVDVPVLH